MSVTKMLLHGLVLALVIFGIVACVSAVWGATIYACNEDGVITFSDSDCSPSGRDANAFEIDAHNTGWNSRSAMEENAYMLQSFERQLERPRIRVSPLNSTMFTSARLHLREIGMECGQLMDQLRIIGDFGAGSYGKSSAIQSQLEALSSD